MDMDQQMRVLFCVVCWSALAMSVTAFLFFLGLSLKHISSDEGKMKATSHAATRALVAAILFFVMAGVLNILT
jgi:uncharacterized RDD family membrane protein YckC